MPVLQYNQQDKYPDRKGWVSTLGSHYYKIQKLLEQFLRRA